MDVNYCFASNLVVVAAAVDNFAVVVVVVVVAAVVFSPVSHLVFFYSLPRVPFHRRYNTYRLHSGLLRRIY